MKRWFAAAAAALCLAVAAPGFTALAAAQTPPVAQAPAEQPVALSPEQAARLHTGMLELRRLQRENNRAGAIQLGEELLREFPDNRRVEDALLDLYRVERRDDRLLALLRRRIERDPAALDEARELCTYLLAQRRIDDAREVLQQVIAANPLDEARYRMGAVLMRSYGQTELSVEIYRQGRKAIGREDIFATELAQLAEARGDYEAAIGEYLLLVMDPDQRARARRKIQRLLERADDPEEVLAQIDKLVERHPKSSPLHDVEAMALVHVGRFDAAFAAIKLADRYAEDQGEHLLELGRMALQQDEDAPVNMERTRLGVRVLEFLPQAHPDSNLLPEASRLLAEGLVTVARQAPEAARRELLEAAVRALDGSARDSRLPNVRRDALALKGLILYQDLGQPEAALETFAALQKHQQQHGESDLMARVQMALCLAALERFDAARALLAEVAAVDDSTAAPLPPQHPQVPRASTPETIGRARARYYLAAMDLAEGQYDRARDGFAALAEQAPEDRLANDCLDLALTLNEASFIADAALGRFRQYHRALLCLQAERAQAELAALVSENPDSPLQALAFFELGKSAAAAGKYDVAVQHYASLVHMHPQHRLAPRALEATADLQLEKLRQREQAVATYERILLEYPDDLFQDDVRQKLLAARVQDKEEAGATP